LAGNENAIFARDRVSRDGCGRPKCHGGPFFFFFFLVVHGSVVVASIFLSGICFVFDWNSVVGVRTLFNGISFILHCNAVIVDFTVLFDWSCCVFVVLFILCWRGNSSIL
jgi:hypothetical protein